MPKRKSILFEGLIESLNAFQFFQSLIETNTVVISYILKEHILFSLPESVERFIHSILYG